MEQNSQSVRTASVTQRRLDTRRDYVLNCSCTLLASQLFATRLRWPRDRNPADGNLQKHFAVQAAATCSELRLPFRATQRRCNFARAAIAHGVHVARASSKSCVILQLTGQLHNRLLYACGEHAIVTRADATCSCTARSNPPRLQEPQRGCARGVETRGLQEPCRANAIDCITVAVMARCVEDAVRIVASQSTAVRFRCVI